MSLYRIPSLAKYTSLAVMFEIGTIQIFYALIV